MSQTTKSILNEADIGSGEKNPAQLETEKMIEKVGNKPLPDNTADKSINPDRQKSSENS